MRLASLLLVSLFAQATAAQVPDSTRGATVSGVVYDSIGRAPLGGAMVQIVSSGSGPRFGSSAAADSLGRYSIPGVPEGKFTLGFFHPMLDSIGVEPPLREVSVAGTRAVRADLGIPSAARLRAVICGAQAGTGGVVVGFVRDARDGSAVSGASVAGEWLELSFTPQGLKRNTPRLTAKTAENGWFAMCSVPTGGSMRLLASRGADSTDLVQADVSAEGFLRRELFVGASRTVLTGDTARKGDTSAVIMRRRAGDGRLSGTVVADSGGKPVAGAIVGIVDGPQARTNERGEWALADAPSGTRILEARAVGRFPQRRTVDVVAGAPPLKVSLATLKSVLDTIRVVASRTNSRDIAQFEERRQNGIGKYFTATDLAKRGAIMVSDVFKTTPGVRIDVSEVGEKLITMRSTGIMADRCSPRIFVNGMPLFTANADDVDAAVKPEEIAGIEVYTGLAVPAEYKEGLSAQDACGVILIWRK